MGGTLSAPHSMPCLAPSCVPLSLSFQAPRHPQRDRDTAHSKDAPFLRESATLFPHWPTIA